MLTCTAVAWLGLGVGFIVGGAVGMAVMALVRIAQSEESGAGREEKR